MSLNYKNIKAFTLIEMLVVISLIGILAALAMVSFSSVQKQARDTSRKSDLKQYQTAIESYVNKNNGNYLVLPSTLLTAAAVCTPLAIGTCPPDPKNIDPLVYRYIGTATSYAIWARLENKSVNWVVCSNGKNGELPTTTTVTANCPLP